MKTTKPTTKPVTYTVTAPNGDVLTLRDHGNGRDTLLAVNGRKVDGGAK